MTDVPYPRKIRLPHETYGNPEHVFHIVFRALPDTAPFHGHVGDVVWALALDEAARTGTRILAACLMPDHLHMVTKPGAESLLQWVNTFKSLSTHRAWAVGTHGALWQPGFYDRLLRDDAKLEAAIQYVLTNPIEAGLKTPWPWLYERARP